MADLGLALCIHCHHFWLILCHGTWCQLWVTTLHGKLVLWVLPPIFKDLLSMRNYCWIIDFFDWMVGVEEWTSRELIVVSGMLVATSSIGCRLIVGLVVIIFNSFVWYTTDILIFQLILIRNDWASRSVVWTSCLDGTVLFGLNLYLLWFDNVTVRIKIFLALSRPASSACTPCIW